MTNRKLEIVARLRDSIPDNKKETIDQAMITWWANIRPEGGLRLTKHGYEMLHNVLKMESWSMDLAANDSGAHRALLNKRIILDLDHKLQWPYYIDFNSRKKIKRIVFFSSREAMMATMYGDLQKWLNSLD